LFGDVETTADVTGKLACFLVVRNSPIENPTPSAVVSSYAVPHFEDFAPVEVGYENIETAIEILWVYTLCPAVAALLIHGTTRELKPSRVKVIAQFVGSSAPNQVWGLFDNDLKFLGTDERIWHDTSANDAFTAGDKYIIRTDEVLFVATIRAGSMWLI
jgi:hypothetical protein